MITLKQRVEWEPDEKNSNASWPDVEAAVNQLDNKKYTDLSIDFYPEEVHRGSEGETALVISGGRDKRYVVNFFDGGDGPTALHDYANGNEEFEQVIGGTATDLPAHYSISHDMTMQAVRYFFDHHTIDPSLEWVNDELSTEEMDVIAKDHGLSRWTGY